MQKNKKRYKLASTIVLLMFLSFMTGIFAAKTFLTIENRVPVTIVDVDTDDEAGSQKEEGNAGQKEEASVPTNPSVEFEDKNGKWKKSATISLFKASYDNESGEVTVKSANGDHVIAPGTSNKYEFWINNTGDTGIYYLLESAAKLEFVVNGESKVVPLQVKYYDMDGKYLVGSENAYADMLLMDGLERKAGLSSGNYMKYIVEWQWPFEGDDELDTLLGSMSAVGDGLFAEVQFTITASEDPSAVGGSPNTGDSSNIALWSGLCACSFVLFIILLVGIKKDDEDEAAN